MKILQNFKNQVLGNTQIEQQLYKSKKSNIILWLLEGEKPFIESILINQSIGQHTFRMQIGLLFGGCWVVEVYIDIYWKLTPITNYNNQIAPMNSSNSELWEEDLSYSYKVEDEQSCRRLITILEESHIAHFDLEVSFMQEYQLTEFQNEWMQQTNAETADNKALQGQKNFYLQRPHDCPYEQVMDLGTQTIRGMVFMDVFREELEQMKYQYQVKMSAKGQRLYIFKKRKEELNIICQNKLMEMNQSLCIFYGHEPNLILILNVSSRLRKQLFEKKVNVWFRKRGGKYLAVFFSVAFNFPQIPQMLAIIQEITQFDISIFSLHHNSIKRQQTISVKEVLHEALKQQISTLESEYQIDLQFCEDNNYIVFHTKHASFGIEPVQIFKQKLNRLVIISVKSHNIKQFDNKMRKLIRECPFATQMMSKNRSQTFLAINLAKIYDKPAARDIVKQVEEFLKLFLILIEPKFQIKIYLNHLTGDIKRYIQRIIDITEKFNMIIKNEDFYDLNERKAILQLRDLSENVLVKRQKDLVLFLQALIVPHLQEEKDVQFIDESSLDNLSSLGNITSNSHILSSSRNQQSLIDERFEIPWLKLQYTPPKCSIFEGEDRDYRKDRRRRDLEDLFNSNSASKYKVWSVELSSNLILPKENIGQNPYLFRSIFKDLKLSGNAEVAILESFKLKQEGIIGFFTNQIAIPVIPLFTFQRIQ